MRGFSTTNRCDNIHFLLFCLVFRRALPGFQHPSTTKLRALAQCYPSSLQGPPSHLSAIVTPLLWRAWSDALQGYPDQQFAHTIVEGIRDGFHIGYNRSRGQPTSASRNMRSALEHQDVVSTYIARERALGRVLGPFTRPPFQDFCISSFGVIPKRNQPGKWRLIMDLSSPDGRSINDGIEPDLCSLSYVSIDDIAEAIARLGRGTLIAKSDIQQAYRQIPVHPQDRHLLGMHWQGAYFVDTVLPFGLRSAPLIFSAVADALEWVVRQHGVEQIFHYIDDFVMLGPPQSDQCRHSIQTFSKICSMLGCPLAPEKTEGPATVLTVLGIEFDTMAMELRLPSDKLERIRTLLDSWCVRRSCQRRDLESLVGLLQHASKVVRPGRIFLRRLYDLLKRTQSFKEHFFVRLNAECQADIEWWHSFVSAWNGVSMLRSARVNAAPDVNVWSDASGGWGCGAFWQGQWFQIPWGALPISGASISPKEFFPIIVACIVWGERWRDKRVCLHCDNMAVVNVINNQTAKEPLLCHHLRCLFFASAYFGFEVVSRHTPGASNTAADALSRNNMPLFRSQMQQAALCPTLVPVELQIGLSVAQPQWRSREWSNWFRAFIVRH